MAYDVYASIVTSQLEIAVLGCQPSIQDIHNLDVPVAEVERSRRFLASVSRIAIYGYFQRIPCSSHRVVHLNSCRMTIIPLVAWHDNRILLKTARIGCRDADRRHNPIYLSLRLDLLLNPYRPCVSCIVTGVKTMNDRCRGIAGLIAVLLFLVSNLATADVTVERFTRSGGFAGMGAGETVAKESIQGLKKRTESQHKFTGSILGRFGGNGQRTEIVRVDRDLVWDVDDQKKRYDERPIRMPSDESKTARQDKAPKQPSHENGKTQDSDDKIKVIRNEFKVKNTGESKTINGFPCTRTILTWNVETENTETGERSESVMTNDIWVTPSKGPVKTLMQEEMTFNQAYMKKLGLDLSPQEMQQYGLGMMGGLMGASSDKLKKELGKIKGYPIATSVKWQQTAGATDDAGVKSNDGGTAGMARDIAGMLGGFLHKGKKKEEKGESPGMNTVFEFYTEIKTIDGSKLAKSLFEIPSGYKKK